MTKSVADVVCLEAPKSPRIAIGDVFKTALRTFAACHCRLIHRSISRPVNGKYRCWHCLREFETGW